MFDKIQDLALRGKSESRLVKQCLYYRMKTLLVLTALIGLTCAQGNFFSNIFGGNNNRPPPQRRPQPQAFRPRPPQQRPPPQQQQFRPQYVY